MLVKRHSDLSRIAARMRWATQGAIGILVVALAAGVWALLTGRSAAGGLIVHVADAGLPAPAAAAVLVIVGALVGLALTSLVRLLRNVESGGAFRAARELRRFASFVFFAVFVSVALPPATQLLLSAFGIGKSVSIALEGGEVLMLLVTGLLFVVARILDEAEQLADEHSQIV